MNMPCSCNCITLDHLYNYVPLIFSHSSSKKTSTTAPDDDAPRAHGGVRTLLQTTILPWTRTRQTRLPACKDTRARLLMQV